MNQDSNIVLLPIKPRYSKKILTGVKKYEYRKIIPKKNFNTLLIYSSSPEKCIVGIAYTDGILKGHPDEIWESTKELAGIDKHSYQKYFEDRDTAFAIQIKTTVKFKIPIKLDEIRDKISVPQSFLYLNSSKLSEIIGNKYINDALQCEHCS